MRCKSKLLQAIEIHEPRKKTQVLAPQVRLLVLVRDEYQCRLCHRRRPLHVHHIDGQGELSPRPNHAVTNLITLCVRCHRLVHTTGVKLTLGVLLAADERRGAVKENYSWVASVNEHLMQPERRLGLLDP